MPSTANSMKRELTNTIAAVRANEVYTDHTIPTDSLHHRANILKELRSGRSPIGGTALQTTNQSNANTTGRANAPGAEYSPQDSRHRSDQHILSTFSRNSGSETLSQALIKKLSHKAA